MLRGAVKDNNTFTQRNLSWKKHCNCDSKHDLYEKLVASILKSKLFQFHTITQEVNYFQYTGAQKYSNERTTTRASQFRVILHRTILIGILKCES